MKSMSSLFASYIASGHTCIVLLLVLAYPLFLIMIIGSCYYAAFVNGERR